MGVFFAKEEPAAIAMLRDQVRLTEQSIKSIEQEIHDAGRHLEALQTQLKSRRTRRDEFERALLTLEGKL